MEAQLRFMEEFANTIANTFKQFGDICRQHVSRSRQYKNQFSDLQAQLIHQRKRRIQLENMVRQKVNKNIQSNKQGLVIDSSLQSTPVNVGPVRPKPKNAFSLFLADQRDKIQREHANLDLSKITTLAMIKWRKMPEQEKGIYEKKFKQMTKIHDQLSKQIQQQKQMRQMREQMQQKSKIKRQNTEQEQRMRERQMQEEKENNESNVQSNQEHKNIGMQQERNLENPIQHNAVLHQQNNQNAINEAVVEQKIQNNIVAEAVAQPVENYLNIGNQNNQNCQHIQNIPLVDSQIQNICVKDNNQQKPKQNQTKCNQLIDQTNQQQISPKEYQSIDNKQNNKDNHDHQQDATLPIDPSLQIVAQAVVPPTVQNKQ